MNLEEYRRLFILGSLTLILVAAAPTLLLIIPISRETERFTEFWILDPNHMANEYPSNVHVNETYSFLLGVNNHMGSSSYYMIYAKFRNQTQPLPDTLSSTPSPLPPLYESRFFTTDDGTWQAPLTIAILETYYTDDYMLVDRLSIDDMIFSVDAISATKDSEYEGFYYQLFFELWLYNMTLQRFQFHNRFVGIWLRIIG